MPTETKTDIKKTDVRANNIEIRSIEETAKGHIISGKAITFNEKSEYMGFYEIIKPEAVSNVDFSKTLLLYDHDYSNVLARVDSGNLDIEVKKDGVYFTAKLNNTTLANDVFENIKSGNLKGCSFGFHTAKDGSDWEFTEDGTPLHIITNIQDINEITLTPVPAYSQTSAEVVRSLNKIKKEGIDMAEEIKKDKEQEIKGTEKIVEPTKEDTKPDGPIDNEKGTQINKEPKEEKLSEKIKTDIKPQIDEILDAFNSIKDFIKVAKEQKAIKGSEDKPKEEQREIEPEKDKEDDKSEKSVEKVKTIEENKEPETKDTDDEKVEGSEKIGGKKDMTQILKDRETNKKPVEVRNFEDYLKGEKRDVTGMTTSNGEAVLPSQVLDILKQPNDPANLATYVNRVAVEAGTGKLPVLAKASARLVGTEELAKNPDIANATITRVPYDLKTLRGALPVSMEMVQDYPNITSILGQYVQDVKANTEQHQIGAVLQQATAKSATSLDDIKGLFNSLINYGSDRMFVVTNSMFTQLDTLKDAEGRYLLKDDISVATGRTLFGAPLVVVADDVLGGGAKMFVGSVKSFVLEAVKGEVTVNWKDNDYFDQILAVAIRMDVQPADTDSGYFVTYTPASK